LSSTDREELSMSYLLGKLSGEEEKNLEERFFSDDQEFEQLEIAETELIDRYVRNELSVEDRGRFKRTLDSSPRLTERVEIGKLIADKLATLEPIEQQLATRVSDNVPEVKAPWWNSLFQTFRQPAFVFSLLLFLIAGSTLAVLWMKYQAQSQLLASEAQQRRELERQITDLTNRGNQLDQNLQRETRDREELLVKLQTPHTNETPNSQVFLLSLSPGSLRGSDNGRAHSIPVTASFVMLDFDVSDGNYSRYSVTIQSNDGKVISRTSSLRPIQSREKKSVRIKLDVKVLPPGDYVAKLDGVTKDGTEIFNYYPFRIGRR
jgi:hypothetical protein